MLCRFLVNPLSSLHVSKYERGVMHQYQRHVMPMSLPGKFESVCAHEQMYANTNAFTNMLVGCVKTYSCTYVKIPTYVRTDAHTIRSPDSQNCGRAFVSQDEVFSGVLRVLQQHEAAVSARTRSERGTSPQEQLATRVHASHAVLQPCDMNVMVRPNMRVPPAACMRQTWRLGC